MRTTLHILTAIWLSQPLIALSEEYTPKEGPSTGDTTNVPSGPNISLWDRFSFLQLNKVSMEHWRYRLISPKHIHRDSYLSPTDEKLEYGIAVNLDYDLIKLKLPDDDLKLYWRNHWWFDSEETHVRSVGWDFKTGLEYKKLNLYYWHMSRHILEETREDRFPVWDRVGLELIIYER